MPERFAIYFAPATSSPLWRRAAAWLGRDASSGAPCDAEIAGLGPAQRAAHTATARRYGFHATLKAPMQLAAGTSRAALEVALGRFALHHRQVAIGELRLDFLGDFLALLPAQQGQGVTDLAAACVAAFEPFRRPLDSAERARRVGAGLTPYQIGLLDHYGYPYVMDQFRFHLTLSDRLDSASRGPVAAAARAWFAPVLDAAFMLDRLSLFHEAEAGAPFLRVADYPLSIEVAVDG